MLIAYKGDVMLLPEEIRDRRELAYSYKEFDDVNLPRTVLNSATDSEVADQVIEFFVGGSDLTYPTKSYFVAIVYAYCILKYFKGYYNDITEPLRCEDLLTDDDFFVPYNEKSRNIYNKVLQWLETERTPIEKYFSTEKTIKYFKEEFLLNSNL